MCCTSIFTCIMAMVFNFSITYLWKVFLWNVFRKYDILWYLRVISTLYLLTVIYFFQNQLFFLSVLWKIYKIFSWYLFEGIKYVYLLWRQIPKLLILNIHKEYANLFLLLKIFLDCSCIHLFFLIQVWFRFSVKNIWHFIWFHTLIKF